MTEVKVFYPVIVDNGWSVGIAVWGELGYYPTEYFFETEEKAKDFCDKRNQYLGLNKKHVYIVVAKTMFPGCIYTLEDVIKAGRDS